MKKIVIYDIADMSYQDIARFIDMAVHNGFEQQTIGKEMYYECESKAAEYRIQFVNQRSHIQVHVIKYNKKI